MRSIVLFLCISVTAVVAQPTNTDCNTAQLLCAQQTLQGDNTNATGVLPGFCQGTNNLLWYTFTTNSVGGVAQVQIDHFNCPAVNGMDNELSVVILSGTADCNPANFAAVSLCESDSNFFITNTTVALAPNTQYWVVLSGEMNNGATIAAQCGFNITVSGPAVDVVDVDFDAGDDQEIAEGGSVQLNATGGTTYSWSPSSGLSSVSIPDPIADPLSSTTYAVTTVINGCSFTDSLLVEVVRLIDPPNTFSPNGDDINDTWAVPGIADYPGSEVLIYDRWGQKVFKSNGYREPWDGTRDGKAVSEGTYYYYIKLSQTSGRSDPYTGFISLIR
ncbi:MAG TPA: gliding motility-associated C-terminal domain-containing protein [Flavobacteriales bacterium]|nr:gliding motility-associated C-terminal domain-containing protein [Flavobacteriales bacterium]